MTNGAFVIDAAAQLNNMASMMNRQVQLTGAEPQIPDFTAETPDAFQQQMETVTLQYLALKDALVRSDANKAGSAGKKLTAALEQVEMGLLTGSAHHYWMEQFKALQAHSQAIEKSSDIADQRKQFSFLTVVLVNTLKAFGHSGDRLYLQHCPMAFEDTGADWISQDVQIRNPYFGDAMLKCGVTRDSL